ncbi:MAG: hypothetical protein JWS12_802 [Candidatus Saccharibacteria bacterium]|nr:hypothetical protein [Candidatus Saccharibacteria bacterium]
MQPDLKTTAHQRYTKIPSAVLLHVAWRNLINKKLRAFLTIMGIIIGIGSIFFLLSFGLGLRDLVTREVIGNQSIQSIEIESGNSKIIKLDQAGVNKVKGLAHVKRSSLTYTFPGSLKIKGSETDTIVYGIDPDYQGLTSLRLLEGRLLNDGDVKQAFMNQGALNSVGITDPKKAIGQEIQLAIPLQNVETSKKQIVDTYKVVGVIDSTSGSEIFIPRFNFEAAGVLNYSQMKVLADSGADVGTLRKQIESLGYQTSSPVDTIDQINQIFRFFNIILAGFGIIGMIVAVLGMFNTLTVALLERTKEIGLMVALGARNRDMRRLFILEAMLLSLIGAAFGVLLAFLGGLLINVLMNSLAHNRGVTEHFMLFATPFWLILAMFGFMMVVGLVVVYFPARRAGKINPIEALRRE